MKVNYINLVGKLPVADGKTYKSRPTSEVKQIIVHHTAGDHKDIGRVNDTAQYHVDKGWPGIGYHYYIPWGVGVPTVYLTNDETVHSYHCGAQNRSSIGVVLQGDFSSKHHKGKTSPSVTQCIAFFDLLENITERLDIEEIHPHSYYGKKACPGSVVEEWITKYVQFRKNSKNVIY